MSQYRQKMAEESRRRDLRAKITPMLAMAITPKEAKARGYTSLTRPLNTYCIFAVETLMGVMRDMRGVPHALVCVRKETDGVWRKMPVQIDLKKIKL